MSRTTFKDILEKRNLYDEDLEMELLRQMESVLKSHLDRVDEVRFTPPDWVWTQSHQQAAYAEGWGLFRCRGGADDGDLQIQRLGAPSDVPEVDFDEPKFRADADAIVHVAERVVERDPLAQRALAQLLLEDAPDAGEVFLTLTNESTPCV